MKNRIASLALSACLAASLFTGCAAQSSSAASSSSSSVTEQAATQEPKDVQYVLYVGTNDSNTNQPVYPPDQCKERAKAILVKEVGGYTIQEAEGGWVDDNGELYQEYTMVVYLSDTTLDKVHAVCDDFIKEFNQSSVLIQANETTTEFYAGASAK